LPRATGTATYTEFVFLILNKFTPLFTNTIDIWHTTTQNTATFLICNKRNWGSFWGSTSGMTPAPQTSTSTKGSTHNLSQLDKINYKELHTGASQYSQWQDFLKRCASTQNLVSKQVKKSIDKVRKVTDMVPPVSKNSSSSSTASSK
jgi:hypothetical protein